jgi:hypothetical protein
VRNDLSISDAQLYFVRLPPGTIYLYLYTIYLYVSIYLYFPISNNRNVRPSVFTLQPRNYPSLRLGISPLVRIFSHSGSKDPTGHQETRESEGLLAQTDDPAY